MTLQEMIKQLHDTVAEKRESIQTIMGTAIEKGMTPDEAQEAEIAAIEADIVTLEKNLARLQDQQAKSEDAAKSAVTVNGQTTEEAQKTIENIKVEPVLQKGVGLALAMKALIAAKGSEYLAVEIAKSQDLPKPVQDYLTQKAVTGTTTNAGFAAPLLENTTLVGEFLELLRPATIVGKLQGFRHVPFNVKIPLQNGASTVQWVGEGKTKPLTNPTFDNATLSWSKVAGIVLMSDELIKFSSPSADLLVRDDLVKGVAGFLDSQFLDKTKTETTESPASVLNGLTAVASTGTTSAALQADLMSTIKQLTSANIGLDGCYWIMSETRAAEIGLMRDALGNTYFNGMSFGAGQKSLLGLPVITSESVTDKIILIKPSEILLADDGGVDFSYSSEATINTGTDAAPVWVNLFQNNLVALRAERYIRWKKARPQAAAYIQYA